MVRVDHHHRRRLERGRGTQRVEQQADVVVGEAHARAVRAAQRRLRLLGQRRPPIEPSLRRRRRGASAWAADAQLCGVLGDVLARVVREPRGGAVAREGLARRELPPAARRGAGAT